jgi:hypothetical protein
VRATTVNRRAYFNRRVSVQPTRYPLRRAGRGRLNHIPNGALLLVSDSPMTPEGVKTSKSDVAVPERYVRTHLEIGIDALIELRESGESVKHLRFD